VIVYDQVRAAYLSPKGLDLRMTLRVGTNDHNTIYSSCNEDEYHLRDRQLSGIAYDIGAYVGSVSVALAVDNPGLLVLAVEPVEDNCRLIWMNARDNGVGERVRILRAAVGPPGVADTVLHYNFRGPEISVHHAFVGTTEVGNSEVHVAWRDATDHDTETVPVYDYPSLVRMVGPADFMKIDCEGAEYGFLPDARSVPVIVGEWHNIPYGGRKRSWRRHVRAMLPEHHITFSGPAAGPGGFEARL